MIDFVFLALTHVLGQRRNYTQSFYEYELDSTSRRGVRGEWIAVLALGLSLRLGFLWRSRRAS